MTVTIRKAHLVVAAVIALVAAGGVLGGMALGSSKSPPHVASPPAHHATTTTAPPTTTTTAVAPVATTTPTTVPPTTTTAPAPAVPVMNTVQGGNVVRPATIYEGGAHNNDITNITWSIWGPNFAEGSGITNANNCDPDCADGTVTVVTATVTLGQPVNDIFTVMNGDYSASWPSDLWPPDATVADGPLQGSG